MSRSGCRNPVALPVLIDYWMGELFRSDEERLEEHLFDCEDCTAGATRIAAVAAAIRKTVQRGVVRVLVTESFLERVERDGLHLKRYELSPGGSVACTVTPADDVVVVRLGADLGGTRRIDLVWCDANGREQVRLEDIPLDASSSGLIYAERIDELRRLGKVTSILRLVARDEAGDQILGEYTFNHDPTPPYPLP